MQEFILRENVLTDDILIIADRDKVFKGGYIALVKEHTFHNAWYDRENVRRFRNKDRLVKYLNKKYPEFINEGYDIEYLI